MPLARPTRLLLARSALLFALPALAAAPAAYASGGERPVGPEAAAVSEFSVTIVGGRLAGGAATGRYNSGDEVGVTATPERGRRFAGWKLDGPGQLADPQAASTSFLVGVGDARLTALFADILYPVEVSRGLGGGEYPAGERVTLGAYIPEGATFTGWLHEGEGVLADSTDPESTFTTGYGPALLTVGLAFDASALRIRASGRCGTEGMTFQVDGRNVRVWDEVPTEPTTFYYGGAIDGPVRVWLNNGDEADDVGCERELTVEYVELDGRRHMGSAQAINTGQRDARGECNAFAGKRSASLTCRGFIEFTTMAEPDTAAATSLREAAPAPEALGLAPNPGRAGGRVAATAPFAIADVEVRNLHGGVVYRGEGLGLEGVDLDLAGLAPGVYLVALRGAGERLALGRLAVTR